MSNGFEMCDQHTYLFATEGKDCPYCRIEQLEQELAHKQEQCDQLAHEVVELESRYSGAVEVEGKVCEDIMTTGRFVQTDDVPLSFERGQRVKVLVMPVKEVE